MWLNIDVFALLLLGDLVDNVVGRRNVNDLLEKLAVECGSKSGILLSKPVKVRLSFVLLHDFD